MTLTKLGLADRGVPDPRVAMLAQLALGEIDVDGALLLLDRQAPG